MSELLCTELSTIPAVCTGLHEDERRLQILLDQEERFMPCASYPRMQKVADEEQRTRMLEVIYEVSVRVCTCSACRAHITCTVLCVCTFVGGWVFTYQLKF